MKAIVDSSALIWLNKINRLELLKNLYDKLIAPPGVFDELIYPLEVLKFANRFVSKLDIRGVENKYHKLVNEYMTKFKWYEMADVEVFVTYKFFSKADEMVFANKDAKERLGRYGKVRELAELYELAELRRVFNRKDSVKFLNDLINIGYRLPYTKGLRKSLTNS